AIPAYIPRGVGAARGQAKRVGGCRRPRPEGEKAAARIYADAVQRAPAAARVAPRRGAAAPLDDLIATWLANDSTLDPDTARGATSTDSGDAAPRTRATPSWRAAWAPFLLSRSPSWRPSSSQACQTRSAPTNDQTLPGAPRVPA